MKLLEEFKQGTLFAKTTLTITITSFLFITFTLALLAILIVIPTAERSAKELTSNIFLAADLWHQSAPDRRHEIVEYLNDRYQIGISEERGEQIATLDGSPFFYLVKEEIERLTG